MTMLALTAREVEVAILIAGGLRNPEIAVRLSVSPRTVHSHVSHILRKTGLKNRVQVACWASSLCLLAQAALT